MRKIIISLVIIFITISCSEATAQNKTLKYSGMFNLGMLYGSNKSKVQAQTIHGILYRGWFTGIGGGIDDYFQQSIPLFLDIRKTILNKPNSPFLYIDGGINIVNKGTGDSWHRTKMKSGMFYEGGAGYKVALNDRLALNFAAGYSFKDYEENTYYKKSLPTPPYTTDEWVLSNKENYSLQRFVMKLGLQF